MSAKNSPRHRRAFLEALAETGNVTLAADQVRVSKDWAYKLRRRDLAFDADFREAVAAFRNSRPEFPDSGEGPLHRFRRSPSLRGHSIDPAGSMEPLSPLRPRNLGEETVLERGNGRRVQVKRARPGQWNQETEQHFLAALMACCNVQAAAAHVGKSAFAAYYQRRRDPGFARRWGQAIETGMCELEAVLIQNACHFLNPLDAPLPDHLLDGMCVDHAIDIARMNWGKARGLRKDR